MNRCLAGCVLALMTPCASLAAEKTLEPGAAVEYGKMAFYPKRWQERKADGKLFPWEGRQVVLLTTKDDLDGKVMARFVGRLDAGWKLYADLVGKSPRPYKQVAGKPSIAAVPDSALTCGYGCGYIGATGIEVAGFYSSDYPLAKKKPEVFAHYYFYEMGRNYYLFGERHSLFITGYAVFMRYVCMDALKCDDPDAGTRKAIEQAEQGYADSDLSFLKAFTALDGLGEKDPRLKGKDGKPIQPSDQPVMYAAAMLKLRKDHGGDAWVKRFFAELHRCPEVKPDSKEKALRQALNWLVAASVAAKKDLTPVFADRWRMPLPDATRKALKGVDWAKADLDPASVIKNLPAEQRSDTEKEAESFRAHLKEHHPGKKWQTGPTRLESAALAKAYPGQKFYFVFSRPPLPPGAKIDRLIEAYQRQVEDIRKNYVSLTVRVDGKGKVVPLHKPGDYNGGLMKVASDDDAKTAAAAILSLYGSGRAGPGAIEVKEVSVTKSEKGWTCQVERKNAFSGTVTFDAAGKCVGVSKTFTGPVPG